MNRSLSVLVASIVLLIAAAGAYALWYAAVQDASTKDAALETQIESAGDASARAAAASRALDALGPEAAALNARFVGLNDIVPFLEKLQEAGSAVGAAVKVGSVSEKDAPRPHLELAVTITGSFDAVMRALGLIENGPYDIATTQAMLSSGGSDTGSAAWTATANLSVGTKPGSTGTLQPFTSLPAKTISNDAASSTAHASPKPSP